VARLLAGHPPSHISIPIVAWTVTAFQKPILGLESSQPRCNSRLGWAGHEADLIISSSVEVENESIYSSTQTYVIL